jgi:hypothetical protein
MARPKKRTIAPCRVYVDHKVPRGYVEFPREFFEKTGIQPEHHVVLKHKGLQVKERAKENDLLESCDIAMSPRLALYLGIDGGQTLDVEDRITIGDELFDEVEAFVDVLEHSAERLSHVVRTDVSPFKGMNVEQVLDYLVTNKDHPDRSYLVVPPNPEGFGIPRGEICEDPSLTEKVWQPDDGTGKIKLFRPEGGDDDELEPGD